VRLQAERYLKGCGFKPHRNENGINAALAGAACFFQINGRQQSGSPDGMLEISTQI